METARPDTNPTEPGSGPDFRHVETWVFDLDHTLYSIDADRHAAMSERICIYVQRFLGLARDQAWDLQKRYLRDYGSTLSGLVRHHSVDPDAYHDFVNDVDALGLAPDPKLRAGLSRLSGPRLIFTNNCGRYAVRVLERLGLSDLFCDIVDARIMSFTPKPNRSAYDAIVARGAAPGRAAMFDDAARNLLPARELGLTTVWCRDNLGMWNEGAGGNGETPDHIHHETRDLAGFLHSIRI
jgi:putative hydrolase of the HAD superfamily